MYDALVREARTARSIFPTALNDDPKRNKVLQETIETKISRITKTDRHIDTELITQMQKQRATSENNQFNSYRQQSSIKVWLKETWSHSSQIIFKYPSLTHCSLITSSMTTSDGSPSKPAVTSFCLPSLFCVDYCIVDDTISSRFEASSAKLVNYWWVTRLARNHLLNPPSNSLSFFLESCLFLFLLSPCPFLLVTPDCFYCPESGPYS